MQFLISTGQNPIYLIDRRFLRSRLARAHFDFPEKRIYKLKNGRNENKSEKPKEERAVLHHCKPSTLNRILRSSGFTRFIIFQKFIFFILSFF